MFTRGNKEDSLLKKYCNMAMSASGGIKREEAMQLIQLARQIPDNQVIVEIGSYRGRSTIALALGSLMGNKNPVYAVDPHVKGKGIFGATFGPEDQAHLYRNLLRTHVSHIVFVVSLPSATVSKFWPSKNVGLLWIDGDHTYEAVCADYEGWRQYLLPGSIIAFHDSNSEGIQKLLKGMVEKSQAKLLGSVESLQWYSYR